MDTIPLCSHHAVYVADNLVKVYETPRQECPIGIARVVGTTDDIDVAMLADTYSHVIRRLDFDVDDARYQQEVINRGERLVTAVTTGLVPQSLATTIFDRWCQNV